MRRCYIDQQYAELVERIISDGQTHNNRTGTPTRRIWGASLSYDLTGDRLPMVQHKRLAWKTASTELLGFIRGEHDVRWYQQRGCNIWTADHERWHGPDVQRDQERVRQLAAIAEHTPEQRQEMWRLRQSLSYRANNPHSLGRIYGVQWREFDATPSQPGTDQLAEVVNQLRAGSTSRRLIVSGWNPSELHLMALPPCHLTYHFSPRGEWLDIAMHQRSVDVGLGLSMNLFNTALFCHLVAYATNRKPGRMVWFGDDVHLYEPHILPLQQRLSQMLQDYDDVRTPWLKLDAPRPENPWEAQQIFWTVEDYTPLGKLDLPLFVG